jgi:hypothetical protein
MFSFYHGKSKSERQRAFGHWLSPRCLPDLSGCT